MLYFLIIILGAIGSLVGPWWALPLVACLICALKARTSRQAFTVSALAAVTLCTGYSLILVFSGKENLVDKIGALFAGSNALLSQAPSLALVLTIVTLVAGLTTGFAGLAGKHLRSILPG